MVGEVTEVGKKLEQVGLDLGKKMSESKDELAYIGSNLDELWRIKCEIKVQSSFLILIEMKYHGHFKLESCF